MKKEMLINVSQPEECRIAIIEDGLLEELYIERASADNLVGNIYKGRIVNLEPSIQAAFVDFGVGRNGFLHISDVEAQYFRQGGYDPSKPIGEDRPPRDDDKNDGDEKRSEGRPPRKQRPGARPRIKPPIQEIF
ncbi:MAG: S1 RNA-binding domain-containing protein, partial [Planctomycetota bacterium]